MIANRLNVYRDMYQLFLLLASIKTKMSKEFRSTLGERMLTAALDALDCIQRANMYKEDRAKHLVKFVEHFERMKMLVCASFELRAIDGLRRQAEMYIMHCPENNCELKSPEEMWNMFPHSKSLRYGDGTHGEPIGNLISQILANYYLNEFDWMLEREFGFRYHGRYVDDFYIVSEDKKKILAAMPAIRAYLAGIGITLHSHKFFIQHYTKGVRFVGNIVKADRVYVLNRTVNGLRDAIERLNANAKKAINASETMCDEAVWFGGVAGLLEKDVSSVNSYLGFMRHCNAYAVRRRMLAGISDDGYKVVSVVGHFEYIMLKGRYRRRRAMMDALMRRDYDSVFPLIKCDT